MTSLLVILIAILAVLIVALACLRPGVPRSPSRPAGKAAYRGPVSDVWGSGREGSRHIR